MTLVRVTRPSNLGRPRLLESRQTAPPPPSSSSLIPVLSGRRSVRLSSRRQDHSNLASRPLHQCAQTDGQRIHLLLISRTLFVACCWSATVAPPFVFAAHRSIRDQRQQNKRRGYAAILSPKPMLEKSLWLAGRAASCGRESAQQATVEAKTRRATSGRQSRACLCVGVRVSLQPTIIITTTSAPARSIRDAPPILNAVSSGRLQSTVSAIFVASREWVVKKCSESRQDVHRPGAAE